jgi:hypothetical protein
MFRCFAFLRKYIGVVTPYLGQVSQIRAALSRLQVASEVSDLDQKDLQRLDLAVASSGGAEQPKVRVASVDNYQGEEADIILISLVRSNSVGDIGFLSSRERINVLLSRARLGMFMVGNLETLTKCRTQKGRAVWKVVKEVLAEQDAIYKSFPIKCVRHPDSRQDVTSPEQFQLMSPDGGCNIACGKRLPCGHECPHFCHDHKDDHVLCRAYVVDKCPYNHDVKRLCSSKMTVLCEKKVEWKCPLGHMQTGPCYKGRSSTCVQCNREQQALKEHELELERAVEANNAAKIKLDDAYRQAESQAHITRIENETEDMEKERKLAELESSTLKQQNSSGKRKRGHAAGNAQPVLNEIDSLGENRKAELDPVAEALLASKDSAASLRPQRAALEAGASSINGKTSETPSLITTTSLTLKQRTHISKEHPSYSATDKSTERNVNHALAKYVQEGCMAAHDYLEEPPEVDPTHSVVIQSLRVLLEEECTGQLPAPSFDKNAIISFLEKARMPRSTAVCQFALAVWYNSQKLPYSAQDHAKVVLDNPALSASLVPKWLERLKMFGNLSTPSSIKDISTKTPSEAQRLWDNIKAKNVNPPAAMKDLMGMIGLDEVKMTFIRLYQRYIILPSSQRCPLPKLFLHACSNKGYSWTKSDKPQDRHLSTRALKAIQVMSTRR